MLIGWSDKFIDDDESVIHADFMLNGRNKTLLIIDARPYRLQSEERQQVIEEWEPYLKTDRRTLFAVVDPENIIFYDYNGQNGQSGQPILTLPTVDTLSVYDAEFPQHAQQNPTGVGYDLYQEQLVSSWMDDLIYGWSGRNPPYKTELDSLEFSKLFHHRQLKRDVPVLL